MKKNESNIVKAEGNTALATAPASAADFGGGIMVAGREEQQLSLSRVALYQGTAEEEEMYGEHKRGTFLDALENRELGLSIKFMPIFAWATWSVWEQGQRAPVATWKNQREVPTDLLEWKEENGQRTPPKAQESINVVAVVDGEPWPYLFIFKRTGLKCWNKTIQPLEARRGSIGKCPGLYELASVDDKNADGKPFKRLTARPAGEPSPELVDLGLKVYKAKTAMEQKAEELHDEAPADPDEVR